MVIGSSSTTSSATVVNVMDLTSDDEQEDRLEAMTKYLLKFGFKKEVVRAFIKSDNASKIKIILPNHSDIELPRYDLMYEILGERRKSSERADTGRFQGWLKMFTLELMDVNLMPIATEVIRDSNGVRAVIMPQLDHPDAITFEINEDAKIEDPFEIFMSVQEVISDVSKLRIRRDFNSKIWIVSVSKQDSDALQQVTNIQDFEIHFKQIQNNVIKIIERTENVIITGKAILGMKENDIRDAKDHLARIAKCNTNEIKIVYEEKNGIYGTFATLLVELTSPQYRDNLLRANQSFIVNNRMLNIKSEGEYLSNGEQVLRPKRVRFNTRTITNSDLSKVKSHMSIMKEDHNKRFEKLQQQQQQFGQELQQQQQHQIQMNQNFTNLNNSIDARFSAVSQQLSEVNTFIINAKNEIIKQGQEIKLNSQRLNQHEISMTEKFDCIMKKLDSISGDGESARKKQKL